MGTLGPSCRAGGHLPSLFWSLQSPHVLSFKLFCFFLFLSLPFFLFLYLFVSFFLSLPPPHLPPSFISPLLSFSLAVFVLSFCLSLFPPPFLLLFFLPSFEVFDIDYNKLYILKTCSLNHFDAHETATH